jgi:type I restriction enzyme S subunit
LITTNFELPVMSSWMQLNGRRLDCKPYLLGAFQAKLILDKLSVEKEALSQVTKNGMKGIFNGPRFSRIYVSDSDYGIPLLSGAEMLQADLSTAPLISKRQAKSMAYMLLKQGTTLVSSYGTIGNSTYCRADMEGMVGSDNVLKIVPDEEKILPGFLYAYLSGKFGLPLIVAGTSGSVVTYLDPSRVANLPVPRLGEEIENAAHEYVVKAATMRSEASSLLEHAKKEVITFFGFNLPKPLYKYDKPSVTVVSSKDISKRFDGYYYAQWNQDALNEFNKTAAYRKALGNADVTKDVFIPDIFKRMYVDNPTFGYLYLSGAEVYRLSPTSDRYLSKSIPNIKELVLHDGMILVQDSGQLGGLIGRPVLVGRYLDGFACTNNMVRIVPHTEEDQGYIFAVLSTDYGVRLLMREATGSSIPHLEVKRIKNIQIPWPDKDIRRGLGQKVLLAKHLRDDACDLEIRARELVEKAIREG